MLLVKVVPVMDNVPELAMAAPELALEPAPLAALAVKVQLVRVAVPAELFSMPPPADDAVTTLPVKVQELRVTTPTL